MKLSGWLTLGAVWSLILWQCESHQVAITWVYRWALFLSFLLLGISYRMRIGLVGCAFGYLALNGLIFAEGPWYEGLDPRIQTGLHWSAALSLAAVLVFPLAASSFSRGFFRARLLPALQITALILSGLILVWGDSEQVPLTHNPTMTGTFIAVIILSMTTWFSWAVSLGALFKIHAVTPLACLAVGLTARTLLQKRRELTHGVWGWSLILSLISIPLVTPALVYFAWGKLQDGHGRYSVWRLVFEWFFRQPWMTHAFGAGLGSTSVLVPLLQLDRNLDEGLYLYLHSDWLQIFFEAGAVGLLLSLTVFGLALLKSWRDPIVCAMCLAYGVAMATNFPLHQPLTALVGLMLFKLSLGDAHERRD